MSSRTAWASVHSLRHVLCCLLSSVWQVIDVSRPAPSQICELLLQVKRGNADSTNFSSATVEMSLGGLTKGKKLLINARLGGCRKVGRWW